MSASVAYANMMSSKIFSGPPARKFIRDTLKVDDIVVRSPLKQAIYERI